MRLPPIPIARNHAPELSQNAKIRIRIRVELTTEAGIHILRIPKGTYIGWSAEEEY